MLSYILRRIIWLIPVFIAVSLITFTLMHLTPGGPWDTLNAKTVSPAIRENIKKKYNLDKPLPQQYIEYMAAAVRGDLGPAFSSNKSVSQIITEGFPLTAALGLAALGIAIFIGIPLGVLAALRHNSIIDQTSMFIVTLGISVPSFVLSLTMIVLFSVAFRILPYQYQRDSWQSWLMPAAILALGPTALLLRLTRAATLEVLNEDYIRTARAKGLPTFVVNSRHVLRNALIPVITLLGPLTASLITGSFVVESIFGVPGIGRTFITSVTKRDYSLLMGTTLFYTLIIVAFNLLVDLTYSFIDPRITRV